MINSRIKDILKSKQAVSIAVFSLFTVWLVSFPYQGQVLYALAGLYKIDLSGLMHVAIAAHGMGLLCCGFIIKTEKAAKKLLIVSAALCIVGSGVFFFEPSVLWTAALLLISFVSGCWIAGWGFFFRSGTPKGKRALTAACILIIPTSLMIPLNMLAIHISAHSALLLLLISLAGCLILTNRLPAEKTAEKTDEEKQKILENAKRTDSESDFSQKSPRIVKALLFLCLFIFIITINSGLMFQVINPAFSHFVTLTSWYWAVPYIIAMPVFIQIQKSIDRSYILFAAIAMNGLSFIVFTVFSPSVTSYIAVDTLLLASCGIFDLFWWSILGEMLDFWKNPARVLGTGLATNVGGVLFGELIATAAAYYGISSNGISLIALTVVCLTLVILPPLYKHLSKILSDGGIEGSAPYADAGKYPHDIPADLSVNIDCLNLTEREKQVVLLLIEGGTYKAIAKNLNVSENTVKTHVKNVYSKLHVQNRTELIKRLISASQVPAKK